MQVHLWLILLVLLLGQAQALFSFFTDFYSSFLGLLDPALKPVWDFLAAGTCQTVESLFVLQSFLDCDCDGDFSLSKGLEAGILCGLSQALCLSGDNFCGTSSFEADWSSAKGLTKARACFQIKSGLPDNIPIISDFLSIPELCIRADPSLTDMLGYRACRIELGGSRCQSCQICPSGIDLTFDCSNVDINPDPKRNVRIQGPNLNGNCVGLGLVFNLTVARGSVRNFGMPPEGN